MNCGLKQVAKMSFIGIGTFFLTMQVFFPLGKNTFCAVAYEEFKELPPPKEKQQVGLHILRDAGFMVKSVGVEANFAPPIAEKNKRHYASNTNPSLFQSLKASMFTASSIFNTTDKPDITIDTKKQEIVCSTEKHNVFLFGLVGAGIFGILSGILYMLLFGQPKKTVRFKKKKIHQKIYSFFAECLSCRQGGKIDKKRKK
jgi:hypothetical protein